ncbi:MAG TPA: TIGR01459 family HAD-type hydrolase [Rhizomicrobium sp.]
MSTPIPVLKGLHEIAPGYDALFCDVWGVLHDGRAARQEAVQALHAFRATHGPVILLSNAPRPAADVEQQFRQLGVPLDCYDSIVTSGILARDELARRAGEGRLRLLHIGPERDRGIFAGLAIDCVEAHHAEVALCTGLFDDDHEAPEDYRDLLEQVHARGLVLICANPDLVVQRGGTLIYCAGALARLYDVLGGETHYCGKPHAPIYDRALAEAQRVAGRTDLRVLTVGDAIETDIRGANEAGLDALFIADGIHGEDIGRLTPQSIGALSDKAGVKILAAMRALVW